jgi:hypothetical protein
VELFEMETYYTLKREDGEILGAKIIIYAGEPH